MHPRNIQQDVSFKLVVADAGRLIFRSVRNLIIIAPRGGHDSQLILRSEVIEQGAETAQSILAVVNDRRTGSHQPEIASVPIDTAVPCKLFGMIPDAECIVGLIE